MRSRHSLSDETILDLTNRGLDVYQFVIPDLVVSSDGKKCKNTLNPFYDDENPGLSIYFWNNQWWFKDHGKESYNGNAFHFAAFHYKLNVKLDFPEILKNINADLNLGLSNQEPSTMSRGDKNKNSLIKRVGKFTLHFREQFTKYELKYWNRYGITEEVLKDSNVSSLDGYAVISTNGKDYLFQSETDNPIFVYTINKKCWKMYRPFTEKRYRFMWIGEKPADEYIYGWDKLLDKYEGQPPGSDDIIILTGGEKDLLCLKSLGYDAISLNSETSKLSVEKANMLKTLSSNIVIVYDNDSTGLRASKELADRHGFRNVILPEMKHEKLGRGKDVSDYVWFGLSIEKLRRMIEGNEGEEKQIPSEPDSSPISPLAAKKEPENNQLLFPEEVYRNIPLILRELCSLVSRGKRRDVFLFSLICVLSGVLPKVFGYYGVGLPSKCFSNLYFFLSGPAASGKSIIEWAKNLLDPISDQKAEETTGSFQRYESELLEYSSLEVEERAGVIKPVEPGLETLFIPANTSSSQFIKLLADNDESLIMFETEAYSLINSLKNDWANYYDLLLKAFQHEPISLARRLKNEYLNVKVPKLSVIISGTPEQLFKLIPVVEDGLFSRFCFY